MSFVMAFVDDTVRTIQYEERVFRHNDKIMAVGSWLYDHPEEGVRRFLVSLGVDRSCIKSVYQRPENNDFFADVRVVGSVTATVEVKVCTMPMYSRGN